MLQFVIIAKDGTDPDALDRRMTARPFHIETAKKLKEENHFIVSGATLDKEGKMIGSVMLVQFETEEDLKLWLEKDPYVTGDVWKDIVIKPFRVAEV
ncbi:MAG: YciI family protein [Chitinophagaceae bacterium]